MATLRDVARLAGVSPTTASNVLNRAKPVSPQVAERVHQAAQALGYRPNRSARALRTGKSASLGLVIPNLNNPFFAELAQAVIAEARARGFTVLLIDALEDRGTEAQGLALLEEHRVEGAVWIPVGDFHDLPFPVVLVDRLAPGQDGVGVDHCLGGRLQARHAWALGHRRVGLVVGPQDLDSARLRREGFLTEARARGLEVAFELEAPFDGSLAGDVGAWVGRTGVSFVACANDLLALAVIRRLAERGIAVPGDVSVVGFDDIPWAALVHPSLSTVRQPLRALGREALNLLLRRLAEPGGEPLQVRLPVELIPRASTKEVRA